MNDSTIGNKSRVLHHKFLVTVLAMIGLNYAAQLYIDSKDWFLQGYGFLVWILPAISILGSLLLIDNSKFLLSHSKDIISLEDAATHLLKTGKITTGILIAKAIKTAKEVCQKAGVKYEDLAFFLNIKKGINAGNIGGSGNGIVMLDMGSVTDLNEHELAGVMAHELGHALNGDSSLGSLMKSLAATFSAYFWTFIIVVGYFDGFWWSCGLFLAIALIIPFLKVSVSREMERASDMFAVALGYGHGLYGALTKIANQQGIENPIIDWIAHFGKDHPPLFSRLKDIKMMLNNDQGLVKDKTEARLWSFGKLSVLIIFGLYLSTKEWGISTILGVPSVFYLASIWLYASDFFLTLSNHRLKTTSSSETKTANIILGLLLVITWYALGIYANITVLAMFKEFHYLAYASLILWIAKPITILFSDNFASIYLINQIGTYTNIVSMLLAILILALK